MNVKEQFNIVAKEYDAGRRKFISCFDEYYQSTTNFITSNIETPKRILDLGAGTGLLSNYWYNKFPSSEYVLVDIADEMINVAKKRFLGIANVNYEIMDYSKTFPSQKFDCIISALSIHHLENNDKERLFTRIYDNLPEGGIFVNYDQFCGGTAQIDKWFDSYWEKQLGNSSLTPKERELGRERRKLDREVSVETEVQMLKQNKFAEVKCVYSCQKFAVILAIK